MFDQAHMNTYLTMMLMGLFFSAGVHGFHILLEAIAKKFFPKKYAENIKEDFMYDMQELSRHLERQFNIVYKKEENPLKIYGVAGKF